MATHWDQFKLISTGAEPDVAPSNIAIVLFNLATDQESVVDDEVFMALINTATSYLHHEKFQKALIDGHALNMVLGLLTISYAHSQALQTVTNGRLAAAGAEAADLKLLTEMRTKLIQALSDVSALPEYSQTYPVSSALTITLREWLTSPHLQLQVCACIMLGNLARSDAVCEALVNACKVHESLIAILRTANDSQLLHSVLGFLKNLALPIANKASLGKTGLFEILPRLWAMDTIPQIQYSAISLARQLVVGDYDNVKLICQPLSRDPDSPAHEKTSLSVLLSLFQRSDQEPTKMEITRLIAAIVRVLGSAEVLAQHQDAEERRRRFYTMHADMTRPLTFMVTQTKWPVVRSEGWFVLALMSRTMEGAMVVSDMMHNALVFQPLVEILSGKSIIDGTTLKATAVPELSASLAVGGDGADKSKADEVRRSDRENALVLVNELLKHCGDDMAVFRRDTFLELLKDGGKAHVVEQNNTET